MLSGGQNAVDTKSSRNGPFVKSLTIIGNAMSEDFLGYSPRRENFITNLSAERLKRSIILGN